MVIKHLPNKSFFRLSFDKNMDSNNLAGLPPQKCSSATTRLKYNLPAILLNHPPLVTSDDDLPSSRSTTITSAGSNWLSKVKKRLAFWESIKEELVYCSNFSIIIEYYSGVVRWFLEIFKIIPRERGCHIPSHGCKLFRHTFRTLPCIVLTLTLELWLISHISTRSPL